MVNFLTYTFILGFSFWILKIISNKKRELEEKEKQQREQFLKETQSLLKTEAPSFTTPPLEEGKPTDTYRSKVSEYFKINGYNIAEASKAEGIDLIGIQEKELLLIRCETTIKEVKVIDLKQFLAECCVYVDKNPMFKGRTCSRLYATNRPITDEAQLYIRENSSSIRIVEDI
jgi:hypothetical protein